MGQIISYGCSFARNVILARVLTKADFGLAAVFGMTVSLLEVAGRMSFGQQIIQSKDGDRPEFQATSQAFQFVLSIVGCVLIVGLSALMARAFRMPDAVYAFALLAVVPLARGFENLDYCRQQRALNYVPAVLCEVVPQAVTTLAAWPLAVWLGDYSVIVWLMIGKAGMGLLMTRGLAKRPYRWAWDTEFARKMWSFGWPLLLTGLLVFASQQADQMLVGAFLSLDELAAYALALSLVSIPWFIFAQVGSSLMLPILSRAQDEPAQFCQHYRVCVEYAGVGAVILTLPLIAAGEQLVTLFYGSKYVGAGKLMALLGAASAVRFLRFVPAVAAMARADTLNQFYSNLWRGFSLPLAAIVVISGGGVSMVAACALVAELVAGAVSVMRLRRLQGVPYRDTAGAAAYVLGFVAAGLSFVCLGASHWGFWLASSGMLAIVGLAIVVARVAFPGLARTVLDVILSHRRTGLSQPAADTVL
ncbi:MAG: oligosaccharide flippase family protein [Lentisphaerae bacterium]|nr:oligosaccharide flippase family protein [Lentisphaerota bacterium]